MRQGRHIIFDTWQGKWLEIATMPTGDPRVTVTRWTHHRDRAYLFPSLQEARNMVEALGDGGQFTIQRKGETHT